MSDPDPDDEQEEIDVDQERGAVATESTSTEVRVDTLATPLRTPSPDVCRRHGTEPAEVYDYQRTRAYASLAREIERLASILKTILTGGLVLCALLLGWGAGAVLDKVMEDLLWRAREVLP